MAMTSARGVDLTKGDHIDSYLAQAHLRNIRKSTLEFPVGAWGGRVGTAMSTAIMAGARAIEVPVVQAAQMATKEQFDSAMAAMEYDYKTLFGISQAFYFAYGQK